MNDQKLRNVIRKMIREQNLERRRLMEGDAEELYNVFVAPFTDVVKSASLATQDTLNSLNLVFKNMITLSPKKMEQNMKEFEARKAKIDAKWQPLMDSADVALKSGDAGLIAMVVAPEIYLGAKLGKAGAEAPKNVANYLGDAGWNIPLAGLVGASSPDLGVEPMEKGLMGKGLDIAKQVWGLFYIESAQHSDLPLLTEADDEEKGGIKDFKKELQQHFEDTGLDEVFEDAFNELYESREEFINNIMEDAERQLEFLTAFANAQTFEEFQMALDDGAANGIEVGEVADEVQKVADELAKKADELIEDPKFKEEVADTKLGEDMTDEQMRTAADDAAMKLANETIQEIKEKFQSQLEEGIPALKEQVLEQILEGVPEEGSKEFKEIAGTEKGKKYLELFKNAKDRINAFNINPSEAAPPA